MSTEKKTVADRADGFHPFPLTEAEWRRVCDRLRLTPKQAEVVALVLRGAADKKMAYELGVELCTVRTHLRRLYRKMGVQDRTDFIVRLINVGREFET